MLNDSLYVIFPYVALVLAVAGGLYRTFTDGFSYSRLSSQFLENRGLFWGSVPWHYGIVLILVAHLFGGLFPGASAALLKGPARLFVGEWVGMSLGFFTIAGMIVWFVRRLGNSRALTALSAMDWVLMVVLTAQVVTGVIIALAYRWGSIWYLDTAVPWFWSLAGLAPKTDTIHTLPPLMKFHMVNAFVIIALFPFTRLVHIFAVPLSYLWGPGQVAGEDRRGAALPAPTAATGFAGMPALKRHAPSSGSPVQLPRRRFLAAATGVLTGFVVLVAGIPFVGELLGPIYREKKKEWIKVTDITPLPIDQPANPTFAMPVVEAYIRQTELRKVWVIKHSPTEVTVFSPICVHLGCHYRWNPQTQHFECPCHGSVYAIDGRVLGGPAPRPLDTLPMKLEGGILYVQWEEFRVGIPEKFPV